MIAALKQMQRLIALAALTLHIGVVRAEASHPPHERVTRWIASATQEVLLAAPSLRSRRLAEVLHEAITVRGVDVFIIASPELIEEHAGYIPSLHFAGAHVRLGQLDEGYLIVDRTHLATGRFWALDTRVQAENIILHQDPDTRQQITQWFTDAYHVAAPYQATLGQPD